MRTCMVHGCQEDLKKAGHELCLRHWRANRDGKLDECAECGTTYEASLTQCPACDPAAATGQSGQLSSTKIGKHFGATAQRMNLVLAELGWIEKGPSKKGWIPTAQASRRGAALRHAKQTGIPYVVWPGAIVDDKVLLDALKDLRDSGSEAPAAADTQPTSDFGAHRPSQPATLRASDGHLVRSRGELLIDNWLYMAGILHAYERRLPIEQEAYCDFWIPDGKVFIEYWGLDGNASYDERRRNKTAMYQENGLELIDITNADIDRLDDVLPPRLLRYGISSR